MELKIIEASINNLSDIINIENDLDKRILSDKIIKDSLNNKNSLFLLAKSNNNYIGYAVFDLLVDHIDIVAVAVKKDYRNMSVATVLINKIFEYANKYNIKDIFLEVRQSNIPAINLYEKNNFINIFKRENYYKDTNEDAIIYKKELE